MVSAAPLVVGGKVRRPGGFEYANSEFLAAEPAHRHGIGEMFMTAMLKEHRRAGSACQITIAPTQ